MDHALELIPTNAYPTLDEIPAVEMDPSYLDYYEIQRVNREILKRTLKDVFRECSQKDWDGYGAEPILVPTYREAEEFLSSLPLSLTSPYLVPQPDGGIAFEWIGPESRTFIASSNGQGIIYLSWYRGSPDSGGNGREKLSGGVPAYILRLIREIVEGSE